MRKPKPTTVWRLETYGLKNNHTTQTFDPKQGTRWAPRSPYADWAPADSYSEVWVGTITWERVGHESHSEG